MQLELPPPSLALHAAQDYFVEQCFVVNAVRKQQVRLIGRLVPFFILIVLVESRPLCDCGAAVLAGAAFCGKCGKATGHLVVCSL